MIVDVVDLLSDSDSVVVSTIWGPVKARWRSRSPVEVGQRWVVEAGVERVYRWTEVQLDVPDTPGIYQTVGLRNQVVGSIVDLDENGVATIQFGDHLMMLEVADFPYSVDSNANISIEIDDLQLWPHDRLR